MATIRPSDLPASAGVAAGNAIIVDTGASVEKATPGQIVDAAVPLASQAQAEAGTDNATRVSPLRVKQAINALGVSAENLASPAPDKGAALVKKGQATVREILPVTPQEYGAVADGVADDLAAIVAATAAAVAEDRGLHFPDGTYAFSGTLDFTHKNLRVTFGTFSVLKHTGTGKAVQIDSGPYDPVNPPAVYGVQFGWNCPPTIQGNANTTDGIYTRGAQHLKIDARLRDCRTGLRCEFSVMSYFKIRMTGNEGGWEIQNPLNGVVVDRRGTPEATTDCQFDLIIEGMSVGPGQNGYGLDLLAAQHCDFRGTSEANGAGGVRIMPDSINNNFSNFFCENNGSQPHWDIRGLGNIFLNCTGGGPSNSGLNTNVIADTGIRNLFLRGKFHNIQEVGFLNEWSQTQLTGTLDLNANRIQEACYNETFVDLPDNYPAPNFITPNFQNLWVSASDVGGQRAPAYAKDAHGFVHLIGALKNGDVGTVMFVLPAGMRPGGTIWHEYYNVAAGTFGIFAVTAAGEVQHISGTNGSVPIDGISFRAEN